MPRLSIRRWYAATLDRFGRLTRRNRSHLPMAGVAAAVFVFVLLRPELGTPVALALTVITLRRRV